MNILILNWRDPKHPLAGGAEIALYQHAQYWIQKKDSVIWFSSQFKGGKKEEKIDGIHVIRRGSHFTVFIYFFFYYFNNKLKKNVDFVIDCFHYIPFFTPLFVKEKQILALIHEVAGTIWFDNLMLPFSYLGYLIEPKIIRLYRGLPFITVSESTKKELAAVGINKKNINIIYNGYVPIKTKKKIVKENTPTVLFLGRLSKDKGIEDALLMLELLVRDHKNLKLWIVGKFESNDYGKRVKRLIKEFKVKDHCTLYGYVSDDIKIELLARSWLLVHPSTKEGWGLNVIEANSVGTPAVGYNVQGLRDSILNNETGLLCEADAISLADAVEVLIEDKVKLKVFSRNSMNWAKKFNWKRSGKESYNLIHSLNLKK